MKKLYINPLFIIEVEDDGEHCGSTCPKLRKGNKALCIPFNQYVYLSCELLPDMYFDRCQTCLEEE